VLALAAAEQRVLVTSDRDFAELVFLRRRASSGIILVRMHRIPSSAKEERLSAALFEAAVTGPGTFLVVEPEALRRRLLP